MPSDCEEMSTGERKLRLRAELSALRSHLSLSAREEASRQACDRVRGLSEFARAQTVALYAPLGSEIDPGEIGARALEAGKEVLYPRIVPQERQLAFAACRLGFARKASAIKLLSGSEWNSVHQSPAMSWPVTKRWASPPDIGSR